MKLLKTLIFVIFFVGIQGLSLNAQENYKNKDVENIYDSNQKYKVSKFDDSKLVNRKTKNVILMIGDGMGANQLYAALTANRGELNITNMSHVGFSKTHSANKYITDSAAGGTAISTGYKTKNGCIAVDSLGNKHTTILEYAELNGMATGLVSTSAITHATPASFIAHQPDRKMYEAIASDFLETDIDVFIGGGKKHFTDREDGRNIIDELIQKGYAVKNSIDESTEITKGRLGILTADKHNPAYKERGEMLPKATNKAIEVLENNEEKGFFLMVEGSQIDWGGHKNNIAYVVDEVLDFDRAVGEALAFAARDKNTLVIVTADHETGALTLLDGNMESGSIKAHFAKGGHTGVFVPVFSFGAGADEFKGVYENTELFYKMAKLMKLNRK
ncbi:MAG: alkaline phosphatase [Carboxylicivirga sp.]|jgi:alkaline phosphatase|nr:alkaline phosphatase [Carboxylicivirga sp.]